MGQGRVRRKKRPLRAFWCVLESFGIDAVPVEHDPGLEDLMLIYVSVRAYLFGQGEQGGHRLGVGGQVGVG